MSEAALVRQIVAARVQQVRDALRGRPLSYAEVYETIMGHPLKAECPTCGCTGGQQEPGRCRLPACDCHRPSMVEKKP